MYNPNLNNVLLVDVKDLKDLGFLTEELDETSSSIAIKYTQDNKIQSTIGTKLYFILLDEVEKNYDDNNYVIPEKYKILLDSYIYQSLGYFVTGELLIPMTNKLRNKGLVDTSDDRVTPVDYSTTRSLINFYNERGEFYLDMLVKYIQQNYTLYPEFYQGNSFDKLSDTKTFKSSIYIRKNNKCGGNYINYTQNN